MPGHGGWEPLAEAILKQNAGFDPSAQAAGYLNDEVPDTAAALAGAQDILAEQISDDAPAAVRKLRRFYRAFGMVRSVGAKEEDSVYAQYYDYAEPVGKIPRPSHSGSGPGGEGRVP